jgi:hypothetical protein
MSRNPRIRVWTAPVLLAVAGAIGLLAALVADGVGDYIAWLTLAAPVAVVLWCAPRRRTGRRKAQTSKDSDSLSEAA